MIAGTVEAQGRQEGHQSVSRAAVNAFALCHHVQRVEQFEQGRARLVDDANDGAPTFGQFLHQRDALQARRTVQAAVKPTQITTCTPLDEQYDGSITDRCSDRGQDPAVAQNHCRVSYW